MRSDFEQLLWLYSMGVEDVVTRKPQNYSNVQLVKKINDSAYQDGPLLKKSEENEDQAMKENQYFSIPELEYMMSVPEVKKTVWEEWKQKRRTLKNELFL